MKQLPYTYIPILHEDRQAFEVIAWDGRPTGIIRETAKSANGAAQTLNQAVRSLKRRRTSVYR